MLFYRFWRESALRLVAGALAVTGYCLIMVIFRTGVQPSLPVRLLDASYVRYIDTEVFGSFGKLVFVLLVIFLGLGGLMRERAHNTAVFTLALPVSRAALAIAQIAAGLAGVALLALLPALLIRPLSAVLYETYPIAQALRYSLLRFLCGIFIFALSFLLSVSLRGEYTAPIAAYVALIVPARIHHWVSSEYFLNPMSAMDGRWTAQSNINDPLPWTGLAILLAAAFAMFAAAIRILKRQSL